MFQFLLLSIIFISTTTASGSRKYPEVSPLTPNGRIVGGETTTIEKFPYQVQIQVLGFGLCGGSIVSGNWIITAGHCVGYPRKWLSVRAGTSQYTKGGSVHRVDQLVLHENFNTSAMGVPFNDVALLKLTTPLILDETRQPIVLFNQDEDIAHGTLATVTGWGAISEGGGKSDLLQFVTIPIVGKKICNSAYDEAFGGIPNGQICAACPNGGKDSCQGDSGGPLTVNGRLAGIVSWGSGCAKPGLPGVYTEIASYRHWIDAVISNSALGENIHLAKWKLWRELTNWKRFDNEN